MTEKIVITKVDDDTFKVVADCSTITMVEATRCLVKTVLKRQNDKGLSMLVGYFLIDAIVDTLLMREDQDG